VSPGIHASGAVRTPITPFNQLASYYISAHRCSNSCQGGSCIIYARHAALARACGRLVVRERGTATQDAVDAGAGPRRPQALGSRSRPAHATSRRKGRVERRAGLASAASNALMGSSLAVPQGARARPQPREAVCHHTTPAHVLEAADSVGISPLAVSSAARQAAAVAQALAWPVVRPGDRPADADCVCSCAGEPPVVPYSARQSAPVPADH
jgi:hypothetical protein